MLGSKKIRKNYYKRELTTRCPKQLQRGIICFEVVSVIVSLTLMSFFFVLAHDFITQCDYFKADKIVVRGTHRLSEKQVFEYANIKKGINIISVNLSIIRDILLAHPWISEAEVRRELPNIITIEIKEHEPLAILDLGRRFLINVNGEVFKEWTIFDPEVLPIVSGLEFSDLNILNKAHSKSFNAVMEILTLGRVPGSLFPAPGLSRLLHQPGRPSEVSRCPDSGNRQNLKW